MMLIEKLEQEIESLENSFEQFAIVDDEITMVHTATIAGLKMAINIVRQHQGTDNGDPYETGFYDGLGDMCRHHQCARWVSVSERLPEHNKPVLVWVVSKAGNAYAFKSYYENSWHLDFGEVTHWQPLPQPPKQ